MSTRTSGQTWIDVGISLPDRAHGEVRTACPKCGTGKHKSLSVNTQRQVWYCHYCGFSGALRRLGQPPNRAGYGTAAVAPRPPASPGNEVRAYLRRLWQKALPLEVGDPVVTYLVARDVLKPASDAPKTLRYHPKLRYQQKNRLASYHPAMLAVIQRPNGQMAAMHRTYLTCDGRKARVMSPKKMTPAVWKGAITGSAVRLAPAAHELGVAEGIETALSVQTYAHMPCWAALSAHGLAEIELPEMVQAVHIWGDHDATGIQAANALALRLLRQGREVTIRIPDEPGTDWADRQESESYSATP